MVTTPKPSGGRRAYVLLVIFAAVLIYLLAFSLLNTKNVAVSFVFFSATTALIWVMIACAVLGLILGIVGTIVIKRRH